MSAREPIGFWGWGPATPPEGPAPSCRQCGVTDDEDDGELCSEGLCAQCCADCGECHATCKRCGRSVDVDYIYQCCDICADCDVDHDGLTCDERDAIGGEV